MQAATAAGINLETLPCVASRVEVFGHLAFEWSAFHALSTDRQLGMAMGPIPWSAIDRYAIRYRIDGDDFDRFAQLIQAMDVAFLDYHRAQNADKP